MFRSIDTRRSERGATAVMVAILIAVLAAFAALALNVGHVVEVKGRLQNATDAAALAGARSLDGTVAGTTAARDSAVDFASRHITDKAMPVNIDPDADVILGNWDFSKPKASAFTPTDLTPAGLRLTNAVMVRAGRETTRKNALPVYMGALLGKKTADVRAVSVAVRGGPRADKCAVPLAFASCIVQNADGTLNCGQTLTFNSDGTDNVGFTNLTTSSTVSVPAVKSILDGTCVASYVGEPVGIGNGSDLQPLIKSFQSWVGKEAVVPVIDLGSCPARFNGQGTIIGYATITILSVTGKSTKSISLQIDCAKVDTNATDAGGADFGTTAPDPRLVQ